MGMRLGLSMQRGIWLRLSDVYLISIENRGGQVWVWWDDITQREKLSKASRENRLKSTARPLKAASGDVLYSCQSKKS